jgi:hypothetical protein
MLHRVALHHCATAHKNAPATRKLKPTRAILSKLRIHPPLGTTRYNAQFVKGMMVLDETCPFPSASTHWRAVLTFFSAGHAGMLLFVFVKVSGLLIAHILLIAMRVCALCRHTLTCYCSSVTRCLSCTVSHSTHWLQWATAGSSSLQCAPTRTGKLGPI